MAHQIMHNTCPLRNFQKVCKVFQNFWLSTEIDTDKYKQMIAKTIAL